MMGERGLLERAVIMIKGELHKPTLAELRKVYDAVLQEEVEYVGTDSYLLSIRWGNENQDHQLNGIRSRKRALLKQLSDMEREEKMQYKSF